ncbi:MAG: beta strand repeat-containing protein, partial [Spirulinaceae cyanobacterium]
NQYRPNTNLNGNITVANIISLGGEVTIDSRGNVANNGFLFTGTTTPGQDGGDIVVLAAGDINLSGSLLFTSGRQSGAIALDSQGNIVLDNSNLFSNSNSLTPDATGGDLTINARNLTATNTGITSLLENQGNAGNMNMNIQETARIENNIITSLVTPGAIGNSGDLNINAGFLDVADNSQLLLTTAGQGNAGNLTVNTRQGVQLSNNSILATITRGQGNSGKLALNTAGSLQVLNTSAIATNTFGQGNAGDLSLNVREGITVDNNSSVNSDVVAGAVGNGGQVNVTTSSLQLSNNSLMGALTAGQGNAGTFTLQTTGSLQVLNRSSIITGTLSQGNAGNLNIQVGQDTIVDNFSIISSDVYSEAVGNGGQVNFTTGSLQVTNQAIVGTITQGQGNAGTVNLNVSDSLTISNQAILGTTTLGRGNAGNLNIAVGRDTILDSGFINSDVLDNGVGNGGQINLATHSLIVRNGGVISASTNGQGNAGNVDVRVSQNAVFDGINIAASSLRTQVGPNATGNGGSLSLQANNLSVLNGAVISAETQGQGNAGNVQIDVWGNAVFDGAGSGVLNGTTAAAVGNGGQINLNAGTLQLSNGAVLSSSAAGVGVAGDIAMSTGFLSLDRSRILTETRSGDGGNIALNVDGILLLRNESLISTTAGTAGVGGNGGNIDISADFVIGVPLENSDITANAFEGQGGRITITTNGIYGLRFRPQLTPLSDITASSEFGLNGTFTLNLLSFPAEQGVNELPSALVDAEGLVGRDVCAVQNNQIAGGSSFVVTGRGGLPGNPVELMIPGMGQVEWANRPSESVAVRQRTESVNTVQFQPIQGWVVTPEGEIELTAVAPTAEMGNQGYAYPTCENWL